MPIETGNRRLFSPEKARLGIILIFAAAILLYILSANFRQVGHYNDDAWYILNARYFAGIYSTPFDIKGRPPGMSLLLAPFAALFPDAAGAFRIITVVFTLGCLLLLFYVFRDFMSRETVLIGLVLTALNGYTAVFSTSVMAETPYLFFAVLSFAVFRYINSRPKGPVREALLLALPLAAAFYLKFHGITLFISFMAYYLTVKKYRNMLFLALFFLIITFPVTYGNSSISPVLKYMNEAGGHSLGLVSIWKNFLFYFRHISNRAVLSLWVVVPETREVPVAVKYLIAASVYAVVLKGMLTSAKNTLSRVMLIYLGLYIAVLIIWVNVSSRYIFQLLPFLLFYLALELKRIPGRIAKIFILVIAVSYMSTDIRIVNASISGEKTASGIPTDTYEWLADNTDPSSVYVGDLLYRFYLYTGRRMISWPQAGTRDEVYYRLLKEIGADYIVSESLSGIQRSPEGSYLDRLPAMRAYLLKDHDRYRIEYANAREGSSVWRVIKSSSFIRAWEINGEGVRDYSLNRFESAAHKFNKALDIYGDIPVISINMADTYLRLKMADKALSVLSMAIDLNGESIDLRLARARLLMMNGNEKDALKDIETAVTWQRYLGVDVNREKFISYFRSFYAGEDRTAADRQISPGSGSGQASSR